MTQYSTLKINLPNLQLNKLKSIIKKGTKVTLNLSSNVVRDSNDENNFPNKLLLSNKHVLKLRKALKSNSLANIKLSKTRLRKIYMKLYIQEGF